MKGGGFCGVLHSEVVLLVELAEMLPKEERVLDLFILFQRYHTVFFAVMFYVLDIVVLSCFCFLVSPKHKHCSCLHVQRPAPAATQQSMNPAAVFDSTWLPEPLMPAQYCITTSLGITHPFLWRLTSLVMDCLASAPAPRYFEVWESRNCQMATCNMLVPWFHQ